MNTTQMSELYTLHSMVNDPPTYGHDDAKAQYAPRKRLIPTLVRFIVKSFHNRTARVSEASVSAGNANAV